MTKAILRLIRSTNLLVVAFTQILLGWILYSLMESPLLTNVAFSLLVLTTALIAAAGYVINDIYDYDIDLINKPEKLVIGRKMAPKSALRLYWSINILGFIVAIYLAYIIDDYIQLLIYPFAVLMLWAYAKFLKKSFVLGNIVVAIYCAFVPGIIWYAERDAFATLAENDSQSAQFITYVFVSYALMAFLTTVWREVIKDMEDIQGDKAHGAQTLPVRYGLALAQKIATFLGAVVLSSVGYYLVYLMQMSRWIEAIYLLLLSILIILGLYFPIHSMTTKSLHHTSKIIKLIMVMGLGYLFFLL